MGAISHTGVMHRCQNKKIETSQTTLHQNLPQLTNFTYLMKNTRHCHFIMVHDDTNDRNKFIVILRSFVLIAERTSSKQPQASALAQ